MTETPVTNYTLDNVASQVSEYLTHYIDEQATVTVTPSMVEMVLINHDLDQLRTDFGDSAEWVASLIRQAAGDSGQRPAYGSPEWASQAIDTGPGGWQINRGQAIRLADSLLRAALPEPIAQMLSESIAWHTRAEAAQPGCCPF